MSSSAVSAKKVGLLQSPFKAVLKSINMCIEPLSIPALHKIPNRLFMKRVNIGNERFFAQIKKRNLPLVDRFSVDFDHVDIPLACLVKPLKRMKYLKTIFIDGPAYKSFSMTKIMPSLYNRTRGVSSPLLLRQENEERNNT